MANQKDRRAPALRDDTWITQLDGCAAVNPNPQTPYKGTACPVKEVRTSGELRRPAGARNAGAQDPGAGSIQSAQSDGSWLPRIDPHHPWLQRQDSVVDTV